MPRLVVFAGPNGAGKTTFAREYLRDELSFVFLNADEIARKSALSPNSQNHSDISAARQMLASIEECVSTNIDFAIETTLASLLYARKIPTWREQGYKVSLVYLRLQSSDDATARVAKRVAAGGHNIPADVIKRRFARSEEYFETIYKGVVDTWYLFESQEGAFTRVGSSETA